MCLTTFFFFSKLRRSSVSLHRWCWPAVLMLRYPHACPSTSLPPPRSPALFLSPLGLPSSLLGYCLHYCFKLSSWNNIFYFESWSLKTIHNAGCNEDDSKLRKNAQRYCSYSYEGPICPDLNIGQKCMFTMCFKIVFIFEIEANRLPEFGQIDFK